MSQSAQRPGFWRSVKDLPGRTPLRVKLITALLVLVALALAVISVASITILKGDLLSGPDSYLIDRVQPSEGFVLEYLNSGGQGTLAGNAVDWISGGRVHKIVLPTSQTSGPAFGSGAGPHGPPVYLSGPQLQTDAAWLKAHSNSLITLPSQSGDVRWRVLMEPFGVLVGGNKITGTIVVATDVTSAYTTIGQLVRVDLVVSGLLLVLLAVIGIAVIRASLRPLVDIEKTAGAIARGDLSRRVPERDPRTEVGRLGRSLNAMLSQIETAFQSRSRSEAAARRSEEKMRQFVADASHELRTPLTAIRGFAEYYRQRGGVETGPAAKSADAAGAADANAGSAGPQPGTTPETANAPVGNGLSPEPSAITASRNGNGQLASVDMDRIMRRVEQESSRMGVLVEDMLLLARLDQQRPLDRLPVDLLTLAADAVHDARVVAPSRSINLTVGSGAALLVIGDEVRLRQVIGNLMSNALSHTPDGTPIDVLIRSGNLDEAPTPSNGDDQAVAADQPDQPDQPGQPGRQRQRSAAVLEVTDHGPGLTSEQVEHVFERFYRADQARTSGGTGLGLAIVAALVKAHGGAAWVRSQPGSGATFCIALPLAPEAAQGADEEEDPGEDAGPGDEHQPAKVDTAEQQAADQHTAGQRTAEPPAA
jgi:two-component system OmpR family sensor kinase